MDDNMNKEFKPICKTTYENGERRPLVEVIKEIRQKLNNLRAKCLESHNIK